MKGILKLPVQQLQIHQSLKNPFNNKYIVCIGLNPNRNSSYLNK